MSGSGEKEEVKLLWEEAVEAFGRSLPAGRHLVSRGGSTVQQAAQGRWTHRQLGLGWEHQQSCHRRRGLFCWIRDGGSNQAGVMDPPPGPSGVEGLSRSWCAQTTQTIAMSCQGKHLPGSGYGPVRKMPHTRNNSQDQEQVLLPRRRGFPGISHQIFPLQKLSPKSC